jgi:hypothetical protein
MSDSREATAINDRTTVPVRVRPLPSKIALAAALAAGTLIAALVPLAAQQDRPQEIVATLYAGRVIFCVTRDGILVATVEGGGEQGSRPPAIVPVDSGRVGVLLGAAEWNSPGSGAKPLRLDAELPQAAANSIHRSPVTSAPVDLSQPSEIEDIGVAMLDVMRPQVTAIHHKLDLAPDEPLVELLLADYVEKYGPEIWVLQYRIRQQALGNDYWETRPLRPAYVQLYPPEKGKPRTFMEVAYPESPSQGQDTLLAQLYRHDPQIDQIANASTEMSQAIAAILQGDSRKTNAAPVADFLRAALPALAANQAKFALAKLDQERGFQWLVAPPEPLPPPTETKPQEPDAPSLRKTRP